ncbi:hypothetical protein [Actinoplanes sp. NBRC 103695]|uniref:hypothetical protein n=1 Tax=Actinoplanes sp. NBRC 103695 TaxID=3032202 RepID=UPI0025533ECA|nr:hypothetical protein [Actinoplanes sp. NBRC 103695]GLY99335.1 hypothetical protein Acsp02_65880 [Actinoplanes sp. NBRC 103695]
MSDFGLKPVEVLGSYEELRAKARNAPTAPLPPGDPEGRDASRMVVVRFDRRGVPSAVEISAYWRDALTPDGLRQALLAAYRAAFDAAVATLQPIADEWSASPELPLPLETVYADDAAWFDAVRRELDETDERLARNAEMLQGGEVSGRLVAGPAGLVRLVVEGFTVTEVLIDARVALNESPNRIAADALAAFRAPVAPTSKVWE